MKLALRNAVLATTFAFGSALSHAEVVQVAPDTYLITKVDYSGIFGNMSDLKVQVIREANEFAEKQGKIAIPITTRENPITRPMMFASFEYQFRVVDKSDPEAKRTQIVPRPDVVIEKKETISADVRTKDISEKPRDLYSELLKLDDLRKRGIINDREFEEQKRKLLSSQ